MYRTLVTVAVVVLLGGGLANWIWPSALESYIATRIDWRASVAIPLARVVALVEMCAAIGLLVLARTPFAHALAAFVFLAFLLVHTFEFVKGQPATCPCAARMGEALPPRFVHLFLGVFSAIMIAVLLSFVFRVSPFFGKEPLNVEA